MEKQGNKKSAILMWVLSRPLSSKADFAPKVLLVGLREWAQSIRHEILHATWVFFLKIIMKISNYLGKYDIRFHWPRWYKYQSFLFCKSILHSRAIFFQTHTLWEKIFFLQIKIMIYSTVKDHCFKWNWSNEI